MIQVNLCGLDPDDPTLHGVAEDEDLEKLSPRLIVEPAELLKESTK
jgi:hypothetical protein